MHTSDILVSSKTLAHSSDKVLRNTYLLLALTLLFATVIAGASAALALPAPGLIITIVGFYGLMFLTERNRNSGLGLLFAKDSRVTGGTIPQDDKASKEA